VRNTVKVLFRNILLGQLYIGSATKQPHRGCLNDLAFAAQAERGRQDKSTRSIDDMERSDIERALDYLRTALGDGGKPFRELTEGIDVGERTLQRAGERLGIIRTRAGESGAWIWSLPPEPPSEPSPAAQLEVIDVEVIAAAPESAPALILSGPPDVVALISAALELGLVFPLEVSIRDDRRVHKRIYTAPEVYSISFNGFTPTGAENHISVTPMRLTDNTGIYRSFQPTLIWDRGKLFWDEGRCPRPGFWRDPDFRRKRSKT
jgi:hypothetical protein